MRQEIHRGHKVAEANMSQDQQIQKVFAEMADQAAFPPGKDSSIGSFYQAVLDMRTSDPRVSQLIRSVASSRTITPQHLTNLLFRGVQYLKIRDIPVEEIPRQAFRSYQTSEEWTPDVKSILDNSGEELQEILTSKDTTTTKWQRYAGPKVVLSATFGTNPIKIADFGCGGNYGLPGMAKDIPFSEVIDHTSDQFVANRLDQPIDAKGVAIDKQNPSDPEVTKWRIANSFYPKEFDQISATLALERQLTNGGKAHFIEADLTNLPKEELLNYRNNTFGAGPFQAVIMSTILYQLDSSEQSKVLQSARDILDPGGIIIAQDFARKNPNDPKSLSFDSSWFRGQFGYRTFVSSQFSNWQMLEALQWSDGRCTEVRAGEDFDEFRSRLGKT